MDHLIPVSVESYWEEELAMFGDFPSENMTFYLMMVGMIGFLGISHVIFGTNTSLHSIQNGVQENGR